jgi:hypothetical protein
MKIANVEGEELAWLLTGIFEKLATIFQNFIGTLVATINVN